MKYNVIEYDNGAREIEFHISESIISLAELKRIAFEEFAEKTEEELDNMSFHAEEGILVFGEVDWAEEALRAQGVDKK